jgi:DNA-3-methyladenine glycosylase II
MKTVDPIAYLKKADPILATVIRQLPQLQFEPSTNHFQKLIESIISQQLSEKAADTIFARFLNLFPGTSFPTPEQVTDLDTEAIRKAGISYAKIRYIKDLATKVHAKVLDLETIHTFTDEKVIECLVQVKGIGQWTAEMFLMFALGREDVFSYGDQGLKNAMKQLYKLRQHPTPKQAEKISSKWKPYRSWACRYLWASLSLKGLA